MQSSKLPPSLKASRGKQENIYNPSLTELKWQNLWEKEKIYSPNLDKAKKPFYNLMMFPYPSAEGMHVGNMYAFTGADVYGRFQRMQGKDVFEPIGLDGFGIHSENYAIKVGRHPVEQAKISEKNFYRQLKSIGNGFDWTRTVETYKPEYYKWTQWLFIQLFKAGLAYRKKAPVNFCPSCKTVLADEQVVKGQKNVGKTRHDVYGKETDSGQARMTEETNVCERCGTEVEKRDLEQWFFAITKYANRLLANIPKLDWSEKVKIAQEQWIGKSEGVQLKFYLTDIAGQPDKKHFVEVFTTAIDTIFGVTFLVISPELAQKWLNVGWKASENIKKYVKESLKKREEVGEDKKKTGVFSGIYGINRLNNQKVPVWVADYVLSDYGTGAIMAVPAHDQRDFEFAKQYKLPIKQVIKPTKISIKVQNDFWDYEDIKKNREHSVLFNSKGFDGLKSGEGKKKIIEYMEKKNLGKKEANYHLRDWLISRQRYWGPPIPMIFCPSCAKASAGEGNAGWQPVPEKDLPVKLPFIEDYKPLGIHSTSSGQAAQAPLASHPEFYKTKCPKCGMDAKRETDVSDTFLDSAWYFLRYVTTDFDTVAFDKTRVKKWLPVNMYIGGAEHSVLHLLYSRFVTMVLKDLKFIDFEEPFAKFRAHGLIVKDGAKMSKSKGNVVIPDQYVKKFGADTLRTYLMFMGPYSQGGDFRDSGIEGMSRFLRRIWTLMSAGPVGNPSSDTTRLQMLHKTVKKVTEDISNLSYNTAIASLMEYYNFLSDQKSLSREELEIFTKLIAPFAPHVSEELWQNVILSANEGSKILRSAQNDKLYGSIHVQPWPKFDPKLLVMDEQTIVVSVNGKMRDTIKMESGKWKVENDVKQLARSSAKIKKYLEGKKVHKVIYVEGKVINFVVE